MSYIFVEYPSTLTEAATAHVLEYFGALREKDPDFPKVVLMGDGLRIVAVSSDFDLCRVILDAREEAVIDRILEAVASRARGQDASKPQAPSREVH